MKSSFFLLSIPITVYIYVKCKYRACHIPRSYQHAQFKDSFKQQERSRYINEFKNIVVFLSMKSGGQKGSLVMEQFKDFLELDRIFDLTETKPLNG